MMRVFNIPVGRNLRYLVVIVVVVNALYFLQNHRYLPGPEPVGQRQSAVAAASDDGRGHQEQSVEHYATKGARPGEKDTPQRYQHAAIILHPVIQDIIERKDTAQVKRNRFHKNPLFHSSDPTELLDVQLRKDVQNIKIKHSARDELSVTQDNKPSSNVLNPHPFHYTLNNVSLCGQGPVLAIIFVQSAANGGGPARDLIRRTWASVTQYKGHGVRTVFMLGLPADGTTQSTLAGESAVHGDIVQQDFADHYRNLTYKHIMALRWITEYCPHAQYIVKADDDTAVNIFRLISGLAAGHLTFGNSVYCSIFRHMHPRRDRSDKWYVSLAEYSEEVYPPYCEGYAYILDPALAPKLVAVAMTTSYYWIDDVYVTGILMKKIGGGHRGFRSPYGSGQLGFGHTAAESMHDVIFLLCKYMRGKRKEEIWPQIWNNTLATIKADN